MSNRWLVLPLLAAISLSFHVWAGTAPSQTLIKNVNIFDGKSEQLAMSQQVLVEGNLIKAIGTNLQAGKGATVIDGDGRTLMPGLIDAHAHVTLVAPPPGLFSDLHWGYTGALVAREAERMLLRGFTTIRDAGGPAYGIAKAIDDGVVPGPRIYPSGHFIGQTSGHTDFRSYNETHPRDRSSRSSFEREWAFIADGPDEVRAYTREVLRLGATQIKLSVGGGASSAYDPLDTTQYSVEEIRAAVSAAENWGTYVMVHAYHDRSVMNALEAGVRSIEHGALITNDETMIAMREKGAIYCPQALIFSPSEAMLEEGMKTMPTAVLKGKPLRDNLDRSMRLAKKHGVRVAFGVDQLGGPEYLALQNGEFTSRLRWFTPVEILRQATSVNADLVAMSGPRNPYQTGPLGVIAEGAYADMLLVDGNPLEDLELLVDPEKNLSMIMKDGVIYKNTVGQ